MSNEAADLESEESRASGIRGRAVLPPGTMVGRYRTCELIGEGGQGVVYRGEHFALSYPVAIKVLRDADISGEQRSRIRREARLGAELRHPNIVGVLDAGELEDGSPYFVMEHVEGVALCELLAEHRLSAAACVEVGTQLLSALAALDARSVVHRDIKPDNIMLRREVDGFVTIKLLDLGISKATNDDLIAHTLTRTGTLMGTPQYMSPEHVLGEPVDVRSDIYGVAAVLYESLSGEPPHDAPATGALITKVATESARPLREIAPSCPERLADVIDRGLRRRREERWSHPVEMAEHLRRAAHELGLPRGPEAWPPSFAQPRPVGEEPSERTRSSPLGSRSALTESASRSLATVRSRRAPALAPLALLVAVTGTGIWITTGDDPRPSAEARADQRAAAPPEPAARASSIPPAAPVAERAAVSEPSASPPEPPTSTAAPEAPERATSSLPRSTAPRATSTAAPANGAEDPAALEIRARDAFVRGNTRGALSLYRRVIEQAPRRASAWRGLGLVSAATGDRRTARRALARYLSLSPRASDRARIEGELGRLR